jgi:hypothetical protein
MMLTEEQLTEIERLANAATPGRWECDVDHVVIIDSDDGFSAIPCETRDAEFIAAVNPSSLAHSVSLSQLEMRR